MGPNLCILQNVENFWLFCKMTVILEIRKMSEIAVILRNDLKFSTFCKMAKFEHFDYFAEYWEFQVILQKMPISHTYWWPIWKRLKSRSFCKMTRYSQRFAKWPSRTVWPFCKMSRILDTCKLTSIFFKCQFRILAANLQNEWNRCHFAKWPWF